MCQRKKWAVVGCQLLGKHRFTGFVPPFSSAILSNHSRSFLLSLTQPTREHDTHSRRRRRQVRIGGRNNNHQRIELLIGVQEEAEKLLRSTSPSSKGYSTSPTHAANGLFTPFSSPLPFFSSLSLFSSLHSFPRHRLTRYQWRYRRYDTNTTSLR